MMDMCRYESQNTRNGRESTQNHQAMSRNPPQCLELPGFFSQGLDFFFSERFTQRFFLPPTTSKSHLLPDKRRGAALGYQIGAPRCGAWRPEKARRAAARGGTPTR